MKKIIGVIVTGAVIVFLVLGIARSRQEEEVLSIKNIQQRDGVPILAAKAAYGKVSKTNRYYGDVKAVRQTTVSAKLMEQVSDVLVKVGDYVKKDQVLVKFDTTASQSSVIQARLAMEQMEKDYNRLKALHKEGAVSQQALDGIKLQYEVAVENYKTARQAVHLLAPRSGKVARVDLESGDLAHPGDPAVILMDDKKLEIDFEIPQDDRDDLRINQEVEVFLENGKTVNGRITEVSYLTKPFTRMYRGYAEIENVVGLYPGSMVAMDVLVADRDNVLMIPFDALIERGGEYHVALIKDNHAKLQQVDTGVRGEENIEILAGVKAGDVVAVYGHQNIEDGVKVKIMEEK